MLNQETQQESFAAFLLAMPHPLPILELVLGLGRPIFQVWTMIPGPGGQQNYEELCVPVLTCLGAV